MRYQLELSFTALGFFTRLLVPAWVPWSPERLNHAARYLPLVGGIGAATWFALARILPASVSVLVSMAVTIRVSGAFHEDGWADVCDGLGGGRDKSQMLTIMKDSCIGSYGTVGLLLMLLTKAAALVELAVHHRAAVAVALLVAHPLSRLASTSLIHTLEYVREDATSKTKPLARRLSRPELAIATTFGVLPLTLLAPATAAAAAFATVAVTVWIARMLVRRLGGYTGDCLGAAQQATELAAYIALLAAWNLT